MRLICYNNQALGSVGETKRVAMKVAERVLKFQIHHRLFRLIING